MNEIKYYIWELKELAQALHNEGREHSHDMIHRVIGLLEEVEEKSQPVGNADDENNAHLETNWEYMKAAIDGEIDDGGASQEAYIYYNINCPHRGNSKKARCAGVAYSQITREMCVACKGEWLDAPLEP